MKPVPAPQAPNLKPHNLIVIRSAVKTEAEKRGGYRSKTEPRPLFTPEDELVIMALRAKRKWGAAIDFHSFARQLEKVERSVIQIVSAPETDTPTEDMLLVWTSTPEGREFFARLQDPLTPPHAIAAVEGTKAAVLAGAALGRAYLKEMWDGVRAHPDVYRAFAQLAADTNGRPAGHAFRTASYHQTTRIARRILPLVPSIAMGTNVNCVKTIGTIVNDRKVGRVLAVDCTYVAAPVAQLDAGDGRYAAEHEAHIRRRSNAAGFRITKRRNVGKRQPDGTQLVDIESVRGYRVATLTEVRTGIVVAQAVDDPTAGNEFLTLYRLMPQLYENWPDCPVKYVIGDAGFDYTEPIEYLARAHGIALIARRTDARAAEEGRILEGRRYHQSISRIDGFGRAYCRTHSKPLRFTGLSFPSRQGMAPGDLTDRAGFRANYECPDGHRCTISPDVSWSAISALCHTPEVGRQDLYAERVVYGTHRNKAENPWSSMRVKNAQGLVGAYRGRMIDKEAPEGMIALAHTTRAILTVEAARRAHGWPRTAEDATVPLPTV